MKRLTTLLILLASVSICLPSFGGAGGGLPFGRVGEGRKLASTGVREVILLQENFDKFLRGTESNPDKNDLCLEELGWCIRDTYTQSPGWNGGGIYQAGKCAYIYGFDNNGSFELGYLESPKVDASACLGSITVRFRARTVLQQDWLGVCIVPGQGKAQQKFAVIGNEWSWFEVRLAGGDKSTCVQFEPLEDGCYLDDITILQEYDDNEQQPTDPQVREPKPQPATDVTPLSYTAHWQPVEGAEDYALYDYLYHTATTDGEPFYYINTDFSAITEGSLEKPVEPSGDNDFGLYLDPYVGRCDWLAHMPMMAGGTLAFDNSYAAMLPAGLESPALEIAAPGEPLHLSLDLMSPTLGAMGLYVSTDEGYIADFNLEMTPEWETREVVIPGTQARVNLEFIVEDMDAGMAYMDNLRIWQNLKRGITARVATYYGETAGTSLSVATPEQGQHAFSVSAYQYTRDEDGDVVDYLMSRWSAPQFVGTAEGAEVLTTDNRQQTAAAYDLQGRQLSTVNCQLSTNKGSQLSTHKGIVVISRGKVLK